MKRLALLALLLGGCASTAPLQGMTDDGEHLTGTATSFVADPYGGTLELRGARGLVCAGAYRYQADLTGSAPLTCSDGATGFMTFKGDGWHGSGEGTIGGRRFRMTF